MNIIELVKAIWHITAWIATCGLFTLGFFTWIYGEDWVMAKIKEFATYLFAMAFAVIRMAVAAICEVEHGLHMIFVRVLIALKIKDYRKTGRAYEIYRSIFLPIFIIAETKRAVDIKGFQRKKELCEKRKVSWLEEHKDVDFGFPSIDALSWDTEGCLCIGRQKWIFRTDFAPIGRQILLSFESFESGPLPEQRQLYQKMTTLLGELQSAIDQSILTSETVFSNTYFSSIDLVQPLFHMSRIDSIQIGGATPTDWSISFEAAQDIYGCIHGRDWTIIKTEFDM